VGIVTVLAIVDLPLGHSAVLISFLAAGPVVAAARAGPRSTALVGAYAVAVGILLGVADHIFGHTEHLLRVGVVVVLSALAVWIAGLAERLRRSRDELRVILEGVADGVVAQDPAGRLVFANRAALEATGFSTDREMFDTPRSEILDRFEMLDEDGQPLSAEQLPGRRAARGEEPAPTLVRFRVKATGEERWSNVKATPIRDARGHVALAISIMEDVTEQKQTERAQRFLADAGRLLAGSLDYETTLRNVADLAVPDMADWCAIDVLDADGQIQHVGVAAAHPGELPLADELRRRYPPDPDAPTGVPHVLRTGDPELYPEIPDELLAEGARDEEHLQLIRALEIRSVMVVPMVAGGRTLGAITFVTSRSRRSFDIEDLDLAEELGRRAGTAIDNSLLYGERSYIAHALQESLLPPDLPEIPGVEVAARFQAAGDGNEIGGDFYDVFEVARGRWAAVIGDVCGKGADAAAVTALARYTLRAAAMQEELPSAVLEMLNEAMVRQRAGQEFCTVAFASLDTTGPAPRLKLSSGGHPLPLLLRADGSVEPVGSPGTLLGIVPDPELRNESVSLAPGDALVLYTDGVTEAHAPQRIIEQRELEALLRSCAGFDAAAIADAIERAAVDGGHGDPRDDVAILVLRLAER
jgi:PAS domain S-box-containing protein